MKNTGAGCALMMGMLALASSLAAGQVTIRGELSQLRALQQGATSDSEFSIRDEPELPETYPHASYEYRFRTRGGVPTFRWRLEKGALPSGLKLEEDGFLHGSPERTGEFRFTISATDSGQPQQSVQKVFVLRVRSAMTLNWKVVAHVTGNRIDGSAEISNTTPDDIDLTFIVVAVPGNGRAVAIGYQHFMLRRGTVGMELPFGETLPRGGYVVHVDAVGEVARKNVIYRERLQTPSMLQVSVGP